MKYSLIASILLFCGGFLPLSAVVNGNFQEGKKGWAGTGTVKDGILTVTDDSAKGGLYAVSAGYEPITPGEDYSFGALCRTRNVTSRTQIYLRIFDADGKVLKNFATPGYTGEDWKLLEGRVPAKEIPAAAVKAKIILQPAAGPAEATGSADFRNVFLFPAKEKQEFPVPEGNGKTTSATYFKTENIRLHGEKLQQCPFQHTEGTTRLELSWTSPLLPSFFTFSTPQAEEIREVKVSVWNDDLQKFEFWRNAAPGHKNISAMLNLTGAPSTKKLLLNFGGRELELYHPEFYVRTLTAENWNAKWIWFTTERVEHLNCWLRCEFELPSKPVRAILQSAADDGAALSVNGKKAGSAGIWKEPAGRDIASLLQPGRNVLGACVRQARYAAGFLAELDLTFADGSRRKIITDRGWRCSLKRQENWNTPSFTAAGWTPAVELGRPPTGAWGNVPYQLNTPKQEIKLRQNAIPATLEAGKRYPLNFELTADKAVSGLLPVDLVLRRGRTEFQRLRLGFWEKGSPGLTCQLQWTLNPFLPPGDYQLDLEIPLCEVKVDGKLFAHTVRVVNNRRPEPVTAEVRSHNGAPTLFINRKPYFSYMLTLGSGRQEYARSYRKAGVNLIYLYPSVLHAENGNYDFNDLDQLVATALRGNPEAFLMLRITTRNSVTDEFRQRHPDELVRFDNGRVSGHPSLASNVWRAAVRRMLTETVKHIQSSPYADRVIGISPSEGEEGQWMHYWGGGDPRTPGTLSDYSRPMLTYFREWLRKKYKTDEALRKSWNRPDVTFAAAEIPTRAQRIGTDGVFRALPKDRPAIDYAEALSDVVADGILELVKCVKDASGRRMVTGILYGHIIDLGGGFLGEQVGYLKMRRVVESPDLDYVGGPLQYSAVFRDLGGCSSFDYPAPALLRLRNKIWLQEGDMRTHLTNPPGYAYSVRTAAQTGEILAREFAKGLCSAAGMYFCDSLGGKDRGWLDDPETLQTLGQLEKIAEDAALRSQKSKAEIAVVFSDLSLAYLRSLAGRQSADCIMQQLILNREAIGRIGAPFDEYLTDDFLTGKMPDYKLYIFMNAFYLPQAERAAIQAKLKRNGASALWFYAPGVIDENAFRTELSGALTGIPLKPVDSRTPAAMLQAGNGAKFGLPETITFKPVFIPEAPGQEILAYQLDGKTPAVVKSGKSYFSAFPGLTPELFRRIARNAGVFLYSSDNDAVYVNDSYLAVHTSPRPGERQITLPQGVRARQLWPTEKKELLRRIQFRSDSPETRIYRLEK